MTEVTHVRTWVFCSNRQKGIESPPGPWFLPMNRREEVLKLEIHLLSSYQPCHRTLLHHMSHDRLRTSIDNDNEKFGPRDGRMIIERYLTKRQKQSVSTKENEPGVLDVDYICEPFILLIDEPYLFLYPCRVEVYLIPLKINYRKLIIENCLKNLHVIDHSVIDVK